MALLTQRTRGHRMVVLVAEAYSKDLTEATVARNSRLLNSNKLDPLPPWWQALEVVVALPIPTWVNLLTLARVFLVSLLVTLKYKCRNFSYSFVAIMRIFARRVS